MTSMVEGRALHPWVWVAGQRYLLPGGMLVEREGAYPDRKEARWKRCVRRWLSKQNFESTAVDTIAGQEER